MPNVIAVVVEGSADLLNAGAYGAGAVVAIQSAATQTGAYAAISGTGSTPSIAIVSGTGSYTGFDPGGIDSTWYRTRYESAGGARVSDWTTVFQVGDETAGLLCSLYDVQQELGGTQSANDNENILEKIRQVSSAIRGYCRQTFVPDPVTGTTVRLYDGYEASNGGMRVGVPEGIISLASVEVAQYTAGAFSTITAGQWFLRPLAQHRFNGEPATEVWMTDYPSSGSIFYVYRGYENVRLTGQFGWPAVPDDIQGVAVRATVRRFIGKGGGGVAVATGPNGTEMLLPDMSGADRVTLARYRIPVVG